MKRNTSCADVSARDGDALKVLVCGRSMDASQIGICTNEAFRQRKDRIVQIVFRQTCGLQAHLPPAGRLGAVHPSTPLS